MQITTNSFTRSRRGAFALVLVLVILAGSVMPVSAQHDDTPPQLPHGFMGTVRVENQTEPVAEGTVVEVFLDDVKKAETTVKAEGRYSIAVGGEVADAGKTVTFRVDGVLANETATWTSGAVEVDFDLTIKGSGGPFPPFLPCFIATAVYGTETAEEINILREFRDEVLMPSKLGAAFVSGYYEVSPAIAEVVSQCGLLRRALRLGFIGPMVAMFNWSHPLWMGRER